MLVYRVENCHGNGPYMDRTSGLNTMYYKHTGMNHPSPYNDPALVAISINEYCAFDSPEALREWFKGYLRALKAEGFHIAVYEAKRARVGAKGQTLFIRKTATKIKSASMLSRKILI